MAQIKLEAEVKSQKKLAEGVYSMELFAPQIAGQAKAGQFISVYTKDSSRLLPRPISLCGIDHGKGILRIVYRVVGAGTEEFSSYKEGEKVQIMGPLGNGFPLKDKKAILIGGGIGIPPMLELAKELSCERTAVLGYKDELFLNEEFQAYGPVYIATEDGSVGTKGNVLDAIRACGVEGEVIYACGPTPMLRAVKAYAQEKGIECYISLEERMACGIGACLACVCQSKEIDSHSHVHNKSICKDGPVFDAQEVEI